MVPSRTSTTGAETCRPRARGDGSPSGTTEGDILLSAPRPRGWFGRAVVVDQWRLVGPAPAGMVRASSNSAPRLPSRPRAREDGPLTSARPAARPTPRPQGWSGRAGRQLCEPRAQSVCDSPSPPLPGAGLRGLSLRPLQRWPSLSVALRDEVSGTVAYPPQDLRRRRAGAVAPALRVITA